MFKNISTLKLKAAMSRPVNSSGSFDDLSRLNSPSDDSINAILKTDHTDLHDNLNGPFTRRVVQVGMFLPIRSQRSPTPSELRDINDRWKALSPNTDESRTGSTVELDITFGR